MSYEYGYDPYRPPSSSRISAASTANGGHQQAFPKGHPYSQTNPYTNGSAAPNISYYSPQEGLSRSQGYYAPPPPHPLTQTARPSYGTGSRGRDYLLNLTTDISNLNLNLGTSDHRTTKYPSPSTNTTHTAGNISSTSDGSPNYNKRLPPLPLPPPPGPPLHSISTGSALDPNNSHQSYPYTISYLNQNDITRPYSDYQTPTTSSSRYTLSAPPPPLPPRPISESPPDPKSADRTTIPIHNKSGKPSESTPPKTFRPFIHPHSQPRVSDEGHLKPPNPRTPIRPYSDPQVRTSSGRKTNSKCASKEKDKSTEKIKSADKGKGKATRRVKSKSDSDGEKEWTPKRTSIIDLTLSDSDSYSGASTSPSSELDTSLESISPTRKITPRSNARRRRAISEQPLRQIPPQGLSTPTKKLASARPVGSPNLTTSSAGKAIQCSGYTRSGQPCKRLVKVEAPFLAQNPNLPSGNGTMEDGEGDERSQRVLGRYCKDHAGMICQVGGFYWRGEREKSGVWIDFDEFIPPDLGQQTQTLLRMTMESKLTAKESPGFLYAYELKDLETDTLAFYKVGRTDNVPRRIGQWTHQCQSKTPTLRDIFPLPSRSLAASTSHSDNHNNSSNLQRSGTLTTSYLPGATTHRTPPSLAMKRWERLVHLELSDRCASHPASLEAYEKVREKCDDCGLGHREIFPLVKTQSGEGKDTYDSVVVEVVGRWERFIKKICQG